jgi:hypothetical protein
MTLSTGSRVGPYELQDRVASTDSGERFTASETGLERPVSIVVSPLPDDLPSRDAIRSRARALAGLADTRLLPVYGQGEEDGALWLTTRHLAGRSLADVTRLQPAEAARLGVQLADQLAALADAGLAPASLSAENITVEGEGGGTRAWLVPDPGRPTADSATRATAALVELLDARAGKKLLDKPPSGPRELSDALKPLTTRRRPGRRTAVLVAGFAVAAGAVAAALALTLGSGDDGNTRSASTAIARVVARIPLNAVPYSIVAGDRDVWAVTVDGLLVHVDPKANSVVGAPRKILPDKSYPIFFQQGDSLYLAAGDLLRLDAHTGRVLRRTHVRGKQPFIASLYATKGSLWATVSEQSNFAESLVRYDPVTLREISRSKPFGSAPVLALVDRRRTLAVNAGDGTLTKISPDGEQTRIVVSATLQTAYRSVFSAGRLWIPTHFDQTLLEVDPDRLVVERAVNIKGWTSSSTAGAGSIWVLTERPSRIYRVDSASARLLGRGIPAPAKSIQVAFGDGSLWVDDPNAKGLIRLAPGSPAPAAAPLPQNDNNLNEGPLPTGRRLVDRHTLLRFSVEARDPGWLAGAVSSTSDGLVFGSTTIPGTGVSVALLKMPTSLFDSKGRLTRVSSTAEFVATLRRNPALSVGMVSASRLGGMKAVRVTVRAHPKPPFPALCHGQACVLIFPIQQGTFTLAGGAADELTLANAGGKLFLADLTYGGPQAQRALARGRRLVASFRLEP